MLRHGDTANIELLGYTDRTRQDPPAPRPTEPGGAHFAFYADDIVGTAERLARRADVQLLGSVEKEQCGPIDGLDWVYLLTSWGLVIELLR